MAKSKFYAVRKGREGPKIYYNWPECETAVKRWPGARFMSFVTEEAAQAWLAVDSTPASTGNPWLIADSQTSHRPSPLPETLPSVPLDVGPFTEDFLPLLNDSDVAKLASKSAVKLSDEQQHILNLAKDGKNIFFTGSAGTGKSVLLREIITHFGGGVSESLAITASTGIAAVNIGGVSLHSWAGIGLGIEHVDKLIGKVKSNKYSRNRWRQTKTIIIDEISMVDGVLYDKLETIARDLRNNDLPFGGIQLVLSGDFCQLPPVPDRHEGAICFAFEARSWKKCFDMSGVRTVHRLTKVFRQNDEIFIDMLNSLRHGQPDARVTAQFQSLSRPIHYSDGLEPCELFPLREQVREANEIRLRRLTGKSQNYVASDIPGRDIYNKPVSMDKAQKLLDRLIAPDMIELKVGAQVMLIKNLVQGELVNGSMGQVVAFQSLAEAQGLHTEIAQVDGSKASEQWEHTDHEHSPMDKPEKEVYVERVWPLVRFLSGRTLLLTPVEFEVVNVSGQMEARRDQVPLILSWALSIHKSQGQTLERVKVDLGRVFEKGQAYVALSRATCLAGLQVLNFQASKVMAHPRVLEYYTRLEKNEASQPELMPPAQPNSQPYDEFDEFDDEDAMASYYAVA